MSTSAVTEEAEDDDVEFVSEGLLRPVLECIDLVSDGEDDAGVCTIEDQVDRQKAQAVSTLDRLARQVAVEKRERAEKCKAFKEKMISLQAHGRQELAVRHCSSGDSNDAKRCVDIWLKMPGLKPGVISTDTGWRRRSAPNSSFRSCPQTCPVINCCRVYDNVPLLEGHLKRFDHSPCDPTITLKGNPACVYACMACGKHFDTKEAWKIHLDAKWFYPLPVKWGPVSNTHKGPVRLPVSTPVPPGAHPALKTESYCLNKWSQECSKENPYPHQMSVYPPCCKRSSSSNANGHTSSQTCQLIVCFACPACYLLFNIRDECLQHMAAKNHFTHFISLFDVKTSAEPVPVPRYAKNRLITLCKDVAFSVKCTACSRVLSSHMEAKAHFNVHCRQGCAIAEASQSIAQVMKQTMTVLGRCTSCAKLFLRQRPMEEHREQTQHVVEAVTSVEQALLYYSSYCESRHGFKGHPSKSGKATGASPRRDRRERSLGSCTKRQRISSSGSQADGRVLNLAWFCECGLRYLEEEQASRHLLSANQIFHKCAICGKLMGESSIARLHMSRFHGGAHLSNFLFHCRLCKVEMPRMEDILAHVGVAHRGHTYYQEREDVIEKPSSPPSPNPCSSSAETQTRAPAPSPGCEQRWLCRMCEDLFESETAAHEHCSDVSAHSFQRFACGHCPQKFFKESTLRRHCANEHGGHLLLHYYCGLCDSMLYDSELEFQEHYGSLHSRDYYLLDQPENGASPGPENPAEAATTRTSGSLPLCPCMGSKRPEEERKSLFTRCMKRLAGEGGCEYVCRRCAEAAGSYAEMKTHMYLKHEAQGKDKSFNVVCTSCSESHSDVPSFHSHYHAQHCLLEPCASSRSSGFSKMESPAAMILNAEELSAGRNAEEFQDIKNVIASSTDITVENPKDSKDDDEEMKLALALSAEEAKKPTEFDQEMEEALKRSLEDF